MAILFTRLTTVDQPQINLGLTLLGVAYPHDELLLDIYGYYDYEEGFDVQTVTQTGCTVDLGALLSNDQFRQIGYALDRKSMQAKAESHGQALIDNYEWDCAMRSGEPA